MAAPVPQSPATGPAGKPPRVLVMGAGRVGCWLGGRLQAAGAKVDFVGRPHVLQVLRQHGLTLHPPAGEAAVLAPATLRLHEALPAGRRPDLVLLCVRAGAAAEAAAALNAALPAGTLVLAMQNGISTAELAQQAAPDLVVLRGLVPFLIAERAAGHLLRSGGGALAAQTHLGLLPWLPWFEAAGLPLKLQDDLLPLQWGQLLLNLNHAVHALSGLPLRAQLLDSDLRACTAGLVGETLHLMGLAGIRPATAVPLRPALLPATLRLPTPLFRLAGRSLLPADAEVRGGMAIDLMRRRPTEIDAFQGDVLRLAHGLGQLAPINARITQMVRSWSPRSLPHPGTSLRKHLGV